MSAGGKIGHLPEGSEKNSSELITQKSERIFIIRRGIDLVRFRHEQGKRLLIRKTR